MSWPLVGLLVVVLAGCWLWIGSFDPVQPMPCDRDEVYVWETYPTDAACVANTKAHT